MGAAWLRDAVEDIANSTSHEWTREHLTRMLKMMPTGEAKYDEFHRLLRQHGRYMETLKVAEHAFEQAANCFASYIQPEREDRFTDYVYRCIQSAALNIKQVKVFEEHTNEESFKPTGWL